MHKSPAPSHPPRRASRRIYLVNIGVNTSHQLKSPIYPDGRFEFVPIPEDDAAQGDGSGAVQPVRYRDLYCYNAPEPLLSLFPRHLRTALADRVVHYDPHLGNRHDDTSADFSYGDVPWVNQRASALKQAQFGDWLLFLANLADFDVDHRRFHGQRSFYLIGMIEIDQALEYLPTQGALRDRDSGQAYPLEAYARNAHVNRALRLPDHYRHQPFSVFQGTSRSMRFARAVSVTPELCRTCFTDKNGQPFDDARFPSFTACVGAHTRSVRAQYSLDIDADRRRFRMFRDQIAGQVSVPDLLNV